MKKQHPYYYKLMRVSKTTHLLATVILLYEKGSFYHSYAQKIKPLINDLEKAMLKYAESASFYTKQDLLKDD